jgi:hypothetical protein
MQWLTNLPLGDKPILQIAALAVIALVAITALIIAYRALFGHRLRFSGGGKARQPRLGLVDAFSLDGQRQLVIVRRDNVEHLLMIGGPNDVVVESQIVRAQPQLVPRDKDTVAPLAGPKPPAPVQAPAPAPVPTPLPAKPSMAPAISPLRAVAQPAPVVIPTPTRAPMRSDPAPTIAQPRVAQTQAAPQPAASSVQTLAPKVQTGIEPADNRGPNAPLVLPSRTGNPIPRPSPMPSPIIASIGPGAPAKPLVIPMPPPAPAQKAPAPPASTPPAASAKRDPFAGLDSLEAEMARLLGRDP